MKELRFQTYTFVRLPSGSHLFFPSLEERSAADGKLDSATIVAYDHPPYFTGALVARTLHLALEEGDFRRLEQDLSGRELQTKPLVIEYEATSEGELLRLVIERNDIHSYTAQLAPGAGSGAEAQAAPVPRAKA